jgi:hypothetical protein
MNGCIRCGRSTPLRTCVDCRRSERAEEAVAEETDLPICPNCGRPTSGRSVECYRCRGAPDPEPVADGSELDREVIREYPHGCTLVREYRDGEPDRYHYRIALGPVKSFTDPNKASLYADVQTVTGGFREEKSGERGIPPAVAFSDEEVKTAYLVSNPTMGVTWVARFLEIDEDQVRDRCESVRSLAEEVREGRNVE